MKSFRSMRNWNVIRDFDFQKYFFIFVKRALVLRQRILK
jgi:hypothetical protein